LATCFFRAANCLAVGAVDCRLPGAAATYIAPATTATPASIKNRFIDPPCRPPPVAWECEGLNNSARMVSTGD
jgi:hypothetical protein